MKMLYFTATWCSPCKTFAPVMDRVSTELGYEVSKLDIEENEAHVIEYTITSVPTVLVLDETSNVVKTINGMKTFKEMSEILENINV